MKYIVVGVVAIVSALATTTASSSYIIPPGGMDVLQVPNGNSVYLNGHYWPAVFHSTFRGGDASSKNVFGTAFAAAGNKWTTALCQADSDGDGFSNGEELGDPNCQWTTSTSTGTSLSGFRTTDISHPGFWSSVPAETYPSRSQTAATTCSRDVAPKSTASDRAAIRQKASSFNLPSGWHRVTNASELVKTFKPDADTDDLWKPSASAVAGCPHQQQDLKDWHAPSTWTNNAVPVAGSSVTLPENTKVLISSCSIPAAGFKKITVPATSQLVFGPGAIHLRVKDIVVNGALYMGSPSCPLDGAPITVTFTGKKSEINTYSNGMVAQGSGVIEIHGARQAWTWTRLAATVPRGSRYIVLQDPVDWSVGEDVVIATSIYRDLEYNQNEERYIAAVHPTDKTMYMLNEPLNFTHYGGSEYQAEVGLLWRSLLFRGDTSGYGDKFGGHIMANSADTQLRVSGARADRMGQRNIMARYPFHMHLLGNGSTARNSYFQQITCSNCYFRCAVVHGTNHSLVRKSVAYNVSGHTFYLEDGTEMFNRVEFNFAVYIHPIGKPASGAPQGGEWFTSNSEAIQPADHTASGFYIPNPHNDLVGNSASGGWAGFSFPIFRTPQKTNTDKAVQPWTLPIKSFVGNTAHSSGYFWSSDAGSIYMGGELKNNGQQYTNGRISHHVTQDATTGEQLFHVLNHTKVWASNYGFATWGDRIKVNYIEGHDCRRTCVVFGEAAVAHGIFNAWTKNEPLDMRDNRMGRQGFQWYDTAVKTILFDIEFRNFIPRLYWRDFWHRNAMFVDLTMGGIRKIAGLSHSKALRFRNVNREKALWRMTNPTAGSRSFNFQDWDGSFVNSEECATWFVGSEASLWNTTDPSCYWQPDWPAHVCKQANSGQQIVGWDMEIPGISAPYGAWKKYDLGYDYNSWGYNYHQADLQRTWLGNMTGWGPQGHLREFSLDKSHHLITGVSGQAWYFWIKEGFPHKKEMYITPEYMPRGAYSMLAMPFPSGTSFSIWAAYTNKLTEKFFFEMVTSPELVQTGNGTKYHFDGEYLYLKIGDMFTLTFFNGFSAHGVDVPGRLHPIFGRIYIVADCGSNTQSATTYEGTTTVCKPQPFKPPAKELAITPITAANSEEMSEVAPLPGRCAGLSWNDPPAPFATCNDYRYQSDIWLWGQHGENCGNDRGTRCLAGCKKSGCLRNPRFPINASYVKPCDVKNKPPHVKDWCTYMNDFPFAETCQVIRCDPITGNVKPMLLPEGTPCEIPEQKGYGRCTMDAQCVPFEKKKKSTTGHDYVVDAIQPLNGRGWDLSIYSDFSTSSVEFQLNSTLVEEGFSTGSVSCNTIGTSVATTFALSAANSHGLVQGKPPAGLTCVRGVNATVSTAAGRNYMLRVPDWRLSSNTVPKITVTKVSITSVSLKVEPSDWVKTAKMNLRVGSASQNITTTNAVAAETATGQYASGVWTFTLSSSSSASFSSSFVQDLQLIFENGHSMTRSLPCAFAQSAGAACRYEVTNIIESPRSCTIQIPVKDGGQKVALGAIPEFSALPNGDEVKAIVFKRAGHSEVPLSGPSWDGSWSGGWFPDGTIPDGEMVIETKQGLKETFYYFSDSPPGFSLQCKSGTPYDLTKMNYRPYSSAALSTCSADWMCTGGETTQETTTVAPPTPAPPTPQPTPAPPTPIPTTSPCSLRLKRIKNAGENDWVRVTAPEGVPSGITVSSIVFTPQQGGGAAITLNYASWTQSWDRWSGSLAGKSFSVRVTLSNEHFEDFLFSDATIGNDEVLPCAVTVSAALSSSTPMATTTTTAITTEDTITTTTTTVALTPSTTSSTTESTTITAPPTTSTTTTTERVELTSTTTTTITTTATPTTTAHQQEEGESNSEGVSLRTNQRVILKLFPLPNWEKLLQDEKIKADVKEAIAKDITALADLSSHNLVKVDSFSAILPPSMAQRQQQQTPSSTEDTRHQVDLTISPDLTKSSDPNVQSLIDAKNDRNHQVWLPETYRVASAASTSVQGGGAAGNSGNDSDSTGCGAGCIAGIIIGILVVLVAAAAIFVVVSKKKRQQHGSSHSVVEQHLDSTLLSGGEMSDGNAAMGSSNNNNNNHHQSQQYEDLELTTTAPEIEARPNSLLIEKRSSQPLPTTATIGKTPSTSNTRSNNKRATTTTTTAPDSLQIFDHHRDLDERGDGAESDLDIDLDDI